MFENCYPNTLDTTVDYEVIDGKPDSFIITGDIDAMWLRDLTAQVWPYLPYITQDERLRKLVEGLVRSQSKCVMLDRYANAFYKDVQKDSERANDRPAPIDGVLERKWEIDSLCYAVRLATEYYRLTGDAAIFDKDWQHSAKLIVKTFKTEQRKDGTPYRFGRITDRMLDPPPFDGLGSPVKPVGLIASAFRPATTARSIPFGPIELVRGSIAEAVRGDLPKRTR
jgi:meiotically up-regulated gene 157 (Mug157) protein